MYNFDTIDISKAVWALIGIPSYKSRFASEVQVSSMSFTPGLGIVVPMLISERQTLKRGLSIDIILTSWHKAKKTPPAYVWPFITARVGIGNVIKRANILQKWLNYSSKSRVPSYSPQVSIFIPVENLFCAVVKVIKHPGSPSICSFSI